MILLHAAKEGFIPESINTGSSWLTIMSIRCCMKLACATAADVIDPSGDFRRERLKNLERLSIGDVDVSDRWSMALALSRSQRAPTVEELLQRRKCSR